MTAAASRNLSLSKALVQLDAITSAVLISYLAFVFHSWFYLLAPALAFFIDRLIFIVIGLLGLRRKIVPLPDNIKARIQELLPLPHRVYFMRTEHNDCQSFSMIFFHIILLPEGFEVDLNTPQKRAVLTHELAHHRFFDFFSTAWIGASGLILMMLSFSLWDGNTPGLEGYLFKDDGGGIIVSAVPVTFAVLLCILSMPLIRRRRESNADIHAATDSPNEYRAFLSRRAKREMYATTKKWQLDTKIFNRLRHPSYRERLRFVLGEETISKLGLALSAFIYGLISLYLPALLAISVMSIIVYGNITATFTTVILTVCFYHAFLFVRDFLGKCAASTFTEKMTFAVGFALGFTIFVALFSVSWNVDYFQFSEQSTISIIANSGPQLFLMAIPPSLILFAAFSAICFRLFQMPILPIFALLPFYLAGCAFASEIENSASVNSAIVEAFFYSVVIILAVSLFLEIFAQFLLFVAKRLLRMAKSSCAIGSRSNF